MPRFLGVFLVFGLLFFGHSPSRANPGPETQEIEFLIPTVYPLLLRLGVWLDPEDSINVREEKIRTRDAQSLEKIEAFLKIFSDFSIEETNRAPFKDYIDQLKTGFNGLVGENSGILDASRQMGIRPYRILDPQVEKDLKNSGPIPAVDVQKIGWALLTFDMIWKETDQVLREIGPYLNWIRQNSQILKGTQISETEKVKILEGILARRWLFLRQFQIFNRVIGEAVSVLYRAERQFGFPSIYRNKLTALWKDYQPRWVSSGLRVFEGEFLSIKSLGTPTFRSHGGLELSSGDRGQVFADYLASLVEFSKSWTESAVKVCETPEDIGNLRSPISFEGFRNLVKSFLNPKLGDSGFAPTSLKVAMEIGGSLKALGPVLDDPGTSVMQSGALGMASSFMSSKYFLTLLQEKNPLSPWELKVLGENIWGRMGKKIFFQKVLEVTKNSKEVLENLTHGMVFADPLHSPSPAPFFPIDAQFSSPIATEHELTNMAYEMEIAFAKFLEAASDGKEKLIEKGFPNYLGSELRAAGWPVFLPGESASAEKLKLQNHIQSKRCSFWLSAITKSGNT